MKQKSLLLLMVPLLLFACKSDDEDSNGNIQVVTNPVTKIFYNTGTDKTEVTVEGILSGSTSSVYEIGFIWTKENKFSVSNVTADTYKDPRVVVWNRNSSTVGLDEVAFELIFPNLDKNILYYAKAYALTPSGAVYGDQIGFTSSTMPIVESASTAGAKTGTTFTASNAVLSNGGSAVLEYGFYYGPASEPKQNRALAGGIDNAGVFTHVLENLNPDTEYLVTAFAMNTQGETLSEPLTMKTNALTAPAANITAVQMFPTAMMVSAQLTATGDDPGVEFGVRYGTSASTLGEMVYSSLKTEDGKYVVQLSNLTPETGYYVAAYAKNKTLDFTSPSSLYTTPALSVPAVGNVMPVQNVHIFGSQVILRGSLISDGGLTVTEYGFLFGPEGAMEEIPTTTELSEDGEFSLTINDLTPLTDYKFAAYAKNSMGTSNLDATYDVATGIDDKFTYQMAGTVTTEPAPTTRRLTYWTLEPFEIDVDNDLVNDHVITFLDRNLGAEEVYTSTAFNPLAAGYYIKWGANQIAFTPNMLADVADLSTVNFGVNGASYRLEYPGNNLPEPTNTNFGHWKYLSELPLTSVTYFCPDGYTIPTAAQWVAATKAKGVTDLNGLLTHFKLGTTGDFEANGKSAFMAEARVWTDTGNHSNATNFQANFVSSNNPQTAPTTGRKRIMTVRCAKIEAIP